MKGTNAHDRESTRGGSPLGDHPQECHDPLASSDATVGARLPDPAGQPGRTFRRRTHHDHPGDPRLPPVPRSRDGIRRPADDHVGRVRHRRPCPGRGTQGDELSTPRGNGFHRDRDADEPYHGIRQAVDDPDGPRPRHRQLVHRRQPDSEHDRGTGSGRRADRHRRPRAGSRRAGGRRSRRSVCPTPLHGVARSTRHGRAARDPGSTRTHQIRLPVRRRQGQHRPDHGAVVSTSAGDPVLRAVGTVHSVSEHQADLQARSLGSRTQQRRRPRGARDLPPDSGRDLA